MKRESGGIEGEEGVGREGGKGGVEEGEWGKTGIEGGVGEIESGEQRERLTCVCGGELVCVWGG